MFYLKFLLILIVSSTTLQTYSSPLSEARQAELEHILRQDCGSCHGMTLKGGLGPALTPEALQNKPKVYLQQTIQEGHPGTPMPPWKSILTPEDIDYLVELLMNQEKLS
jgi:cytochrome c55X